MDILCFLTYMQCFWFYKLLKKNQQDLHIFVLVKSQEHRVKVKNKSINKIPPQWLKYFNQNIIYITCKYIQTHHEFIDYLGIGIGLLLTSVEHQFFIIHIVGQNEIWVKMVST